MISRLEIAQRIFDYDPDTTPHGKLRLVRDQLQAVQSKRRLIEHVLMKLSDDAVYECDCDDDMYIKRETHKITAKRIILEPRFTGDKRQYLPRKPLEDGEWVQQGRDWWKPRFVFGRTLRLEYETLLRKAEQLAVELCDQIHDIQVAINNGEIVLPPECLRAVDLMWSELNSKPPQLSPQKTHSWLIEGF